MKLLSGCADIENPPECFDSIFQMASCLADAGQTALEPMLPVDDDCIVIHSFVSFGATQPDDNCDQISVLVTEIRPVGDKRGCWTHWRATFRVEAVFSAWPSLEEDVDSETYWPKKEDQEKASRWMLAYGMAFAKELWEAVTSPGCEGLSGVQLVSFQGPIPSGPRGECAGWHAVITLDIPPTTSA